MRRKGILQGPSFNNRMEWVASAPLLGQHNAQILGPLPAEAARETIP